ncbi:polyprenyl synthetase family protein [Halosquirtibacter xylanolyticus]|uniref:polyprenyl synthetase family protein n=1 Tax=Halosquirtibacter xylanolyticus TaxID=3374599 RepID=UPI00374880F8|nr:polyprenyl synthetase family protein [Prolixibacteraceae bacterium]
MKRLEEIQRIVETHIEAEIEALNIREPKHLYAPIAYALGNGGKRFRPRLLLMAMEMFSQLTPQGLDAALAVEVFHNFTLLHDDIMDDADLRRGKDTVHKKFNPNTAILSGDAMMISSYNYFKGLAPDLRAKVLDIFTQTALEVCEGQQYDMDFENQSDVEVGAYIEMIRLKTAVLLAASMKIGAIIGGANEVNANLVYDFGIKVGISFQIQDDILDVYGNPETFGKEVGGDIVSNKKTILMLQAMRDAKGDELDKLNEWLSKEVFDREEKIAAITSIYDKLNVRQKAEAIQQSYFDQALESLDQISVSVERKQPLRTVAISLLRRDV